MSAATFIAAVRRGVEQEEPQFFGRLGPWDISAGFFAGFGLGFHVFRDEWDATFACFSVGGIRERGGSE